MKKPMMLMIAALLALVLAACQTLGPTWRAELEPPEGVETEATGNISATLVAERLVVEGTVGGLSSDLIDDEYAVAITDAAGNNLFPLGLTAGIVSGNFEPRVFTREYDNMLRAGQLYVIVRTETYPEGELFGRLSAN